MSSNSKWGSVLPSLLPTAVMWQAQGIHEGGELEVVVRGWKMNENWTMDKQKPNIQQTNLNGVWNDLWRIESLSDQLCTPSKPTDWPFSINQPQPPDILQMLSMLITEDIIFRSRTLFLTNLRCPGFRQDRCLQLLVLLWNSHLTTIFHFVLVCYCLALWTIL